jgi:glyoxalase family protein
MVKKTVNQDDPTVYHLFYADEKGSAGADITFFEYPGAPRGRAGDGMVHTTVFRVGSEESLDYWAERLGTEQIETHRDGSSLRFEDPEGLGLELMVTDAPDAPLTAEQPEIPEEHRLQGFEGVRAYSSAPESSSGLLEEGLGFEPRGDDTWEVVGDERRGWVTYDAPPQQRGLSGAGTVHHVAWASTMEEHEAWRERVRSVGMHPTPVIDRFWFRSVYFREPSGVLFEIATLGPGFTTDEPLETLGEALTLPPNYERYRDQLEQTLTRLPDVHALRSS